MKLLVQLGNHLEELILCPLQVSQQSMTPFGVVRLPAFHIGKQGVSGLIHSVFGFLYFRWPRHDPDSTSPKSQRAGSLSAPVRSLAEASMRCLARCTSWHSCSTRVSRPGAHQRHSELLAIFFAFNSLSEISFRFGQAWILAALVVFLNNVQNPLNGTTESSVLANFELAG